jgi:hypothetical protein
VTSAEDIDAMLTAWLRAAHTNAGWPLTPPLEGLDHVSGDSSGDGDGKDPRQRIQVLMSARPGPVTRSRPNRVI